MKKGSLISKSLIVAGLLATTMTGCGKTPTDDVMQVMAAEVSEIAPPGNGTGGNSEIVPEVALQDAASSDAGQENGISGIKEVDLETKTERRATTLGGDVVEDPELVQAMTDALKKYFEVTYDPAQNDIDITYFGVFEDMDFGYSVNISPAENLEIYGKDEYIGDDGFPTEEALKILKPEFHATFSSNKELTGLYVSFLGWEDLTKPLSLEEIRTVAKNFLIEKNLIVDGKIEFMSSAIISSKRMVVAYQNGNDGAIIVGVDIASGKVEQFEYMTKERAELVMRPKSEAECVG